MLILFIEIGLLVAGIVTLSTGKWKLSAKRVVVGTAARIIGVIAMLPLPLAFGAGFLWGIIQPEAFEKGSVPLAAIVIEVGILVGCVLLMVIIGLANAQPLPPKRERPRDELEYVDDDDREPREQRRYDDERRRDRYRDERDRAD